MNLKKYVLVVLSIFMILLVFVSSASAADANETDVLSVDESANLENNLLSIDNNVESNELNNDTLKVSDDDVLTAGNIWYVNETAASGGDGKSAETAFNTLNDALNTAYDDDTIMIASGTYAGTDNIGLNVSKNLNFIKYGDGEAIFDAEQNSRIWTVTASSINITGLTFKNGKSRYGGAICFENAISNSVLNGIFIDNHVQNYTDDSVFYAKGGAIYFAAMVDNCIINGSFIHNSIKINNDLDFYGDGGAIYFAGMVSNSIFDGNFTNNTAYEDGGSLCFNDTVMDSFFAANFSENFAFEHGSCIYINKNVNNTTFQCTSTGNVAVSGSFTFNGGVNDCDFNMKIIEDSTDHGMLSFLKYTVCNSTFNGTYIHNEAQNGGIFYFEGNVLNCKFEGTYEENFAFSNGGVFYFMDTVINSTFDGVFDKNVAQIDGGVFYMEECPQECIFNGTYNNSKAQFGGVFYLMDGAKNCTFDGVYTNNYGLYGGVSIINGAQNCSITGLYINNTCENLGGTHYFKDNVVNSTVTGAYINNKALEQNGGALFFKYDFTDGTLGGIFINNSASNGGAIYFMGDVLNCSVDGFFALNSVSSYEYGYGNGGTIYFTENIENSTISGKFINNTALWNAGAIEVYGNMTNVIVLADFINNTGTWGGALYVYGDMNNCTFAGDFINNTGAWGGATIFNNVTGSTISGKFSGNNANYAGGALYFRDSVNNSTIFAEFIDNSCLNRSSTIVVINPDGSLENITRNVSMGGALYFKKFVNSGCINGIFINNSARNGSANYFSDVNGVVLSGKYINNTGNEVIHIMQANMNNIVHDSIFINNNNNILSVESGKLQSVNNWFGNNATNYDEKPEAVNVDMDNWLFLNATSNPDEVAVGSTSIIAFKLESYNETSNKTGDYDGSKMDIIFDLSSTLGALNQTTASINEEILYAPSKKGNASITGKFENAYDTICLINILNTPMNVTADNITEGENATINVELPSDATGNVSTIFNGKTYSSEVKDGKAVITISDLLKGDYALNITYSGDDKYDSLTKDVNITVEGGKVIVSAPDLIKYYSAPECFVVNVTYAKGSPAANKSVNITLNGMTYKRTTDENGTASLNINLNSGEYPVIVAVDDVVVNSTVSVKATIDASDVVKVFRNDTQYYATFTDAKGTPIANTRVFFNVNGVFYNRTTNENGTAKLNINLEQGTYIITSMNTVTGENATNNITVIPRIIENKDLTKYYRNASQYTVKIISDDGNSVGAGETVTFNVNGVLYNRTTNESGIAKLNINLQPGDYIITAEYNGCRVSNNITVLQVLTAENLTKKYGMPDQFVAKLVDGQGKAYANQVVTFNVNGVFYNRVTDSSGQVKLNINLMPGEYIITSSYNGTNIANKITVKS